MAVATISLPREYEYQVIQDGIVVASAWGRDHDDVLSQAAHYAAVYAQDGPVTLRIKPDKRKRKSAPPAGSEG